MTSVFKRFGAGAGDLSQANNDWNDLDGQVFDLEREAAQAKGKGGKGKKGKAFKPCVPLPRLVAALPCGRPALCGYP